MLRKYDIDFNIDLSLLQNDFDLEYMYFPFLDADALVPSSFDYTFYIQFVLHALF